MTSIDETTGLTPSTWIDSALADDTYLPNLGMTVAQITGDMIARDERAAASKPKVVPQCPAWCDHEQGHDYESTLHDEVTHTRYHESHPKATVTVTQEERNCGGEVVLTRAKLTVWGLDGTEEVDATAARALAADLLARADTLDEITAAQRSDSR